MIELGTTGAIAMMRSQRTQGRQDGAIDARAKGKAHGQRSVDDRQGNFDLESGGRARGKKR